MRSLRAINSAAILPLIVLGSCASPMVKELTRPIAESGIAQALSSDQLTPELKSYLKDEGLYALYRTSPGDALRQLSAMLAAAPSDRARTLLAGLFAKTGEQVRDRDPEEAVGLYLEAASLAAGEAIATAEEPEESPLRIIYNHSCRSVSRLLFDTGSLSGDPLAIQGPVNTFQLKVRRDGTGLIAPELVDEMIPADYLEMKRMKHLTRIRQPGVGGRLVGHREGSEARLLEEPMLNPEVGMAFPITATLEFAEGGKVGLGLHDTHLSQTAVVGGVSVPLATDLTAPLALRYNYAERGNVGLKNMKRSLRSEAETGLYQLEPFRTDQIPVILVHGLKSTPHVWLEVVNRLRSDPVLRSRYQLLVYAYPTGLPIGFNAAILREHLKKFRERYNPAGRNPNLSNMLLIGHSMGGIVSNYQIRDSGQILNDLLFDRPLDQVALSAAQKAAIKPVLNFEANPDIKRVVFIASPHRGSSKATGLIGAIGTAIIRLPIEALLGDRISYVDGMTEEGRQLVNSKLDSVRGLRPDSLPLTSVWKLPNTYGVPLHSLIAQKKVGQPLEDSTDGVVPYSSSHIDGVASEKVIPGEDHNSIVISDAAINELRRILYEHLGLDPKSGAAGAN
ncbi:MAG: esterase/lipase family protein [Verrucomicrobiales bacterium]